MSKRLLVLILALAAVLITTVLFATGCAKKEPRRNLASEKWRRDTFDRYTFLDFSLRITQTQLASIEDEVKSVKEGGGDTAMVHLDDACKGLQAAIQAIQAEIDRLKAELANLTGQAEALADGAAAFARIAGMSKDLSEIEDKFQSIEDKVQSIKEGGGDAGMQVPVSCVDALEELTSLQAVLAELAAKVKAMQDQLASLATASTGP